LALLLLMWNRGIVFGVVDDFDVDFIVDDVVDDFDVDVDAFDVDVDMGDDENVDI